MNSPTLIRRCDRCQRDLAIEPAILGLYGKILCFPCRYELDEAGGERFLHDVKLYPERDAAWQKEFGSQWKARQRIARALEWLSQISGIGIILIIFYIASHFDDGIWQTGLFSLILLFLALCGCFGFSALAGKFTDPPRPQEPVKDQLALHSTPRLLFDGNPEADMDSKFLYYKPRSLQDPQDPPDWGFRRRECLERDERRCRLCKNPTDLDVHHVIPRKRGGYHSLQNLITLCVKCHGEQKYYGHDWLISRNRKGWRARLAKYFLNKARQKPLPEPGNQLRLDFDGPRKRTK